MPPFEIEFDEAKHAYKIDGESVASTTQALGVLVKPGLPWWGMGIGVKGVCELRELLKDEMPWDDDEAIVKLLTEHRKTVNHVRDSAGTRGTSIHRALGAYVAQEAVPNAADFPEADRGFVQALARFLIGERPEPIEAEQIVGSKQHMFAGTFDLLANVHGAVTRLDLKTGKRLYPEVELQLAAYEGAAIEYDHPASERRWAVLLGANGEYEVKECVATFDDFLTVLAAWRTMQRLKGRRRRKVAA